MNNHLPHIVYLGVLAVFVGLTGCGGESTSDEPGEGAVTVNAVEAHLSAVPQVYRYSGTVQGTRKVHLSTRVTGRIQELSVEIGDRIARGQILARIDGGTLKAQRDQMRAALEENRTELESARIHLDRMSVLFETDSATLKELEDATTRHAGALARQTGLEAKLAEVRDALGYTEIVSPLDGSVVGREMEPGDLSTPGRTILVVEDMARLEVVANVPEGDIHLVDVGDTVRVEVGNDSGTVFNARVAQVNPSGQQASRQFEVTVVLDDTAVDAGVMSGMFARLIMRKGAREAITVPESAIIRRGQLTGLFTIDAGQRLTLRWVRTGRAFDEQIEVTSGLAAGELYVASHEGRLQDRQPVRVNPINL